MRIYCPLPTAHRPLFFTACLLLSSCGVDSPAGNGESVQSSQTIRCAVIGGLADTGLWQELGIRFTEATGHRLEIEARGPKHEITSSFIRGESHLIAMHASDTMINLVADGHAATVAPWARNDFVIVGPPEDPAGIRGMKDAGAAIARIIETKSKYLMHSSHGAMEVIHDIMEPRRLEFSVDQTMIRLNDKHRQMLLTAGSEKAYTVIGRIPFLNGKLPKQDLEVLVQGDAALRRPYVVAVAKAGRHSAAELAAAAEFVRWLRSRETQGWIAGYGRGKYDDQPLFFAVEPAEN